MPVTRRLPNAQLVGPTRSVGLGLLTGFALLTGSVGGCTFTHASPIMTADMAGTRHMEAAVEPGASFVAQDGQEVFWPRGSVALRYGLGPRFDLAARVGAGGVQLGGRLALGDPDARRLSLAFAPMISSGQRGIGAYGGSAILPVLIGIPLGDHQLVIGPHLQGWTITEVLQDNRRSWVSWVGPGGGLGLAIAAGERLRILPEITAFAPVWQGGEFAGDVSTLPRVVQGSVAFIWRFEVPEPDPKKQRR